MDILQQYAGFLSTDEQLEQHNQIRNAACQLLSLIDSVSVYNNQERDGNIVAPALLDISQMCATISDEVHKVWCKDHNFLREISCECGTGVFDKVLFRRLLENLLTNAYCFTPLGGSVSLSVKRKGDIPAIS
jgi:signal transduction histidine kinase